MSKTKIWIACHKPSTVIRSESFSPIHVGACLSRNRLEDMQRDDSGENISSLNPMYCELTAQYWAWKNAEADYYGFCHYRRYFNFSDQRFEEDSFGNIREKYLSEEVKKKYRMDDETVDALTREYDVIITERKDLRRIPGMGDTPSRHYLSAPMLHGRDFQTLLQIIRDKYPEYHKAAEQFANGHISCFCNMYILKKDIFFQYCEWMFSVLKEFCDRTDMTHYSTEALRTPGHLSERLFNIFLLKLQQDDPRIKIKELQCVLIEQTDPQPVILPPAFTQSSIPVVFAANNAFVPIFASCLRSLLDHVSEENNYDILLISSDITQENQKILSRMVHDRPNISLRFYHPGLLLQNYSLKANAHISVETYYRFLIQTIFRDYDKVLYLDCDIIICADVARLYHTDISGAMLAAVRDADFLGQINGADDSTVQYCRNEFPMRDPYQYFQAGVLLLNVKEMQKAHSLDEWLTFASVPYRYNDQDVLNLHCEGHVRFIDMKWNLITDCDHYRVRHVIAFAPDAVQKEYHRARQAPCIVHYAGFRKPWHDPREDQAELFWEAARRTPYYEWLLSQMVMRCEREQKEKAVQTSADQPLHIRMLNGAAPEGSRRRKLIDGLYVRVYQRKT